MLNRRPMKEKISDVLYDLPPTLDAGSGHVITSFRARIPGQLKGKWTYDAFYDVLIKCSYTSKCIVCDIPTGFAAGRRVRDRSQRLCGHSLNLQPSALNPQPSALNPQPSTLHPQPSTLNPQPSTHNPQPSTLRPKP